MQHIKEIKKVCSTIKPLAHLSQRLTGELIVWVGCPYVCMYVNIFKHLWAV